ncbi:hypothetical protein [Pedococcus sp. 5OH_020]|uniref:hypothetical protein n=1 Tax=Pedococcus sp. 5OH_020 TaxID=2989814 RepID=UPI003FA6C588
MTWMTRTVIRARLALDEVVRGRERGDVPGWVMVTLMTAGLVAALWTLARGALESLFTEAMNSVRG